MGKTQSDIDTAELTRISEDYELDLQKLVGKAAISMIEKCTENLSIDDVVRIYDNMMTYEHDKDLLPLYKIDYSQFEYADANIDLTEYQLKMIDKIMEVSKDISEKLASQAGERKSDDL